jgi:hypothetical protein
VVLLPRQAEGLGQVRGLAGIVELALDAVVAEHAVDGDDIEIAVPHREPIGLVNTTLAL